MSVPPPAAIAPASPGTPARWRALILAACVLMAATAYLLQGIVDPRVQAAVTAAGYRHVGWHVGAEDWDPARSAAVIEELVVAGALAHGDGTVMLLHAWPRQTLDALPRIIGRLREAGATFVRIDRLDEVPAAPNWA